MPPAHLATNEMAGQRVLCRPRQQCRPRRPRQRIGLADRCAMLAWMMPSADSSSTAKEKFLALLTHALGRGSFVKLTLGSFAGADPSLKKVFIRGVALRTGERLSFVFRHATRDITRNFDCQEGLARVRDMLGGEFRSGHL